MTNLQHKPHWLTRERIRLYVAAFFLVQLVSLPLGVAVHSHNQKLAQFGSPWGNDFRVFWGAAKLAQQGAPAAPYDIKKLHPVMRTVEPRMTTAPGWAHWFYPPTFLLVIAPFGLLGFWLAYTFFVSATIAPYLYLLLRACRPYRPWLLLLAFPTTVSTAFHGQNAFLTAALAAGALSLLPRRPFMAGICIGLLAIKPHMAVLFPVALLAIGAWRTIITAALTVFTITGASYWLFDLATFSAFLDSIQLAQQLTATGKMPFFKMPTVFSALCLQSVDPQLANAVQVLVAAVAGVTVVYVWRKTAHHSLRCATLITASLLVSPYMYEYDLTWLAFPIAWLSVHALQTGWRPGERLVLVLAWFLPFTSQVLARFTGLQMAPILLLVLILLLVRRAQATHGSDDGLAAFVDSQPLVLVQAARDDPP